MDYRNICVFFIVVLLIGTLVGVNSVVADWNDYEYEPDHFSDDRVNLRFTTYNVSDFFEENNYTFDTDELDEEGFTEGNYSGVNYELSVSGFDFSVDECGSRDVRIIVEIGSDYLDLINVGYISTESDRGVLWDTTDESNVFSFDLDADHDDRVEIGMLDSFTGSKSYSFRSARGSEYVEVPLTGDEDRVTVSFDKDEGWSSDDFIVKVKVDGLTGDNWYAITQDNDDVYYYDVNEQSDSYDVQVYFDDVESGDIRVIGNPVFYDYLTLNPMLEMMGRVDDPVASNSGDGYE